MLISAVLDSSVFYTTYFNATYGIQAEDFLNGIEKNGLLIVDAENKLQDAIFEQVEALPTKYRQRLQILVEELFKNKRERVVQCCISPNYTLSGNLLDLAYHLKTISEADVLIVGSESVETLKSGEKYTESIVPLSEYHNSNFANLHKRSQSIDIFSESEMEDSIIHSVQFDKWIASIVNEEIFTSRKQLIELLDENSPHEVLEQEFREFFNGYYVLTLELEEHEKSVLAFIQGTDAFPHLKHRVSAVDAQRKSSPLGREARRMGILIQQDPQPEIKVTDLSTDEFRTLVHTLGNWGLFVLRERLVKLMEGKRSTKNLARLRAEFCEFFVCYLELELFLENYDYDSDEGLEMRPEFIEDLKREDAHIKSGGKLFTLEEVAEELGI